MKLVDRKDLLSVPLPHYTSGNYTTVSHFKALGTIEDCLNLNSLEIGSEKLYLSPNGQVAYGELTLKLELDTESECILTFVNSYNKQRAFNTKAAIRMKDSGNLIVLRRSSYRRVHKGTANEAIETNLSKTIKTLGDDFLEIIEYKEFLKDERLDQFGTFQMLGEMFFDEQILNSEQMNYVKEVLNNKDPLKVYTYDYMKNTAFWMYMLAASALEHRGNNIDAYTQSHTKLNEYFNKKYEQKPEL